MHIGKRVFLYLTRKKGKNCILCIVFFLISFSLLSGSSVLQGISQISKDLRSTIGAYFDVRPYEQFTAENGQVFSKGTPTINEASIQKILNIIGNELKSYNTEQSGYVKGRDISFIAGVGHSEDSNMGQIKAVRDSSLSKAFFNEEYRLIEGNHITPEDKNKVLISKELAQANQLSIGDTILLNHAEFGNENGKYLDLLKENSPFATVEIKGIYEIKNNTDSGLNPTAKKPENIIFSDSQLLFDSDKSKIYNGEVSFFISDPLLLDEITREVSRIASIDWKNHIIEKNDFKFSKIAEQLETIQKIVSALIGIVSVLGIVILTLIMTLRIRGRTREAGILLSIGNDKKEIIGQFVLETLILLLIGFLLSVILFMPVSAVLNDFLFDSMIHTASNMESVNQHNYLQLECLKAVMLLLIEICTTTLTVIVSSATVLSLKPKEILTKMS